MITFITYYVLFLIIRTDVPQLTLPHNSTGWDCICIPKDMKMTASSNETTSKDTLSEYIQEQVTRGYNTITIAVSSRWVK